FRRELFRSNLRGANLGEANLCGANLGEANLGEANLCGANLYGANLCGANLCGAKNKEQAQLPIYCSWVLSIKGDVLKIGCKEKTFEEWKTWFSSNEVFSTKRD